jgi:hypothetical protein
LINFKDHKENFLSLLANTPQLGFLERLLLLKLMDLLVAKISEISSNEHEWWNTNKAVFLENPDELMKTEEFKNLCEKF